VTRVRLVAALVLVAAIVPLQRASAAACDSTPFDGNAYISGSSSTENFIIRHNSVTGNIECQVNGGGFGIVGAKASIGRIDINTGEGGDELQLGDAFFPFEDLSGPDIFASSIFGLLEIDASNSPLVHNLSIDGDVLVSTTTTGNAVVLFSGFNSIVANTGGANDSFSVSFPVNAGSIFAGPGAGQNLVYENGSSGTDSIVASKASIVWTDIQ
jgi:hypothetical protein